MAERLVLLKTDVRDYSSDSFSLLISLCIFNSYFLRRNPGKVVEFFCSDIFSKKLFLVEQLYIVDFFRKVPLSTNQKHTWHSNPFFGDVVFLKSVIIFLTV